MPGAEKAEVADAYKPPWKNMQQKASKELTDGQTHLTLLIAMCRVAPTEDHVGPIQFNEPVVGYRDSMCVAAQVSQNMFRAAERPLAVDHPVFAERLPEQLGKDLRACEGLELAGKREFPGVKCR